MKSPNPKGRPKKVKEPEVDAKKFKDDPQKALLELLNSATSRAEVFKIAKELMPYTVPKLSSIQSDIKEERTVTIQIEGFSNPMVIENNDVKDITPSMTKEDLEQIKKDKLKELEE